VSLCLYKAGDTNTEPRQGDTGGVSNVPDEAESKQANDTSSMAKRPAAQMEKQATESRDNSGSDQNKRPRSQVSLLCVLQEKLLQIEYVLCQLP
jgi:hypothetical protein